VAATSACVCPRVKSAEPWARGITPVSHADVPDRVQVPPVGAHAVGQDLLPHGLLLVAPQDVAHLGLGGGVAVFIEFAFELFLHRGLHGLQRVHPLRLVGDLMASSMRPARHGSTFERRSVSGSWGVQAMSG
jgi:hypothetical protein